MSESRSVKVTLKANVADFTRQLKQASTSLEDLAAKGDKTGKVAQTSLGRMAQSAQLQREAWSTTSTALLGYSVAVTGAIGVAVKKFADFDQAMSMVQADTHETAANMELLRAAALQAGADTQYSATEAAGAVDELAKAGMSTKDILAGGLTGALNLAAAGTLDVASAAEIAASAMTMFGLKGSDINHVADLLAAGAGKAQGSVGDLGAALNNVGVVASNTGLSIEETTGFLAAMASNGIVGAEAGTQLKSMLQSLQAPSSTAQKALDQLGLSLYDSAGNTKTLTTFVGEYQEALKGKTQAEKDSLNATIFGSYGINAAGIAYKEGAQGIQQWVDAVNDQNYAADTARIKMDNLKGDIETLMGSLETGFIEAGSTANDSLRGIVQGATDVVDVFNSLPDSLKGAVVGIGGFTAAGAGLVGISMKMFTSLVEVKTAFDSLKGMDGIMGGLVGKLSAGVSLGGVATAAAPALVALGGALAVVANNAAQSNQRVSTLASTLDQVTGAITANTRATMAGNLQSKGLFRDAEKYGISLRDLTDAAMNNADAQARVAKQLAAAEEKMRAANDASGKGRTLTEAQRTALGDFEVALRDSGAELDDAQAKQRQMAEATGEASDAQGAAAAATEEGTAAISAQSDALQEWLDMVEGSDASFVSLSDAYGTVTDAAKEMAEQTASATDSAQDSWEDYYDGVSFAMDDYLKTLEEQVSAQQNWEQNMLILSGRVSQGVIDELAKLGPEGAPLVANLVNASDEELSRLESVYSQRSSEATGAFAANLQSAGPVFAELMRKNGADAVAQAASELSSGKKTMADIVAQYNLAFDVDAETGEATRKIRLTAAELAALPSEKRIRVILDQVGFTQPSIPSSIKLPGAATGGAITGPGTGTSDSILARLSNGEHVVTAEEVKAVGGQSAMYGLRSLMRSQGTNTMGLLSSMMTQPRTTSSVEAVRNAINGYSGGGAVETHPSYAVPVPREARVPSAYYQSPSATQTVIQQQALPDHLTLRVGDREFTAYVDERSTRMAQEQQKRWARVM